MSLCDRRFVLLGALSLGGCGFRPLYGGGATGPRALFGAVAVETGRGELPFRLREAFVERLTPARSGAPLLLTATTELERAGLIIEDDDEITRYNLTLKVNYALTRQDAAKNTPPLSQGETTSIAAYNATPSQYATLVSEREVAARAAADAADKIVTRLAAAYDPAWLG